MPNSREKQARIRLAARARITYDELQRGATPARHRRFKALNRALALLALGSIIPPAAQAMFAAG